MNSQKPIQYATQKMMQVQLPFQVGNISHFWRNHEIQKRPDILVKKRIPVLFKFEEIETPSVTVFYKNQQATISEYDYDNWFASWWAISGSYEVRARLGLGLLDNIPQSEYPVIKERP